MSKRDLPTIAEALNRISTDAGFSDSRRRQLRSALQALARLQGQPPESLVLHPQKSLALLERASPAELGLKSAATLNGYRSNLRAILRRFGLLKGREALAPVEDPAWVALLERLPQEGHDFDRLKAFVNWLARQGVAPAETSQDHLAAYALEREVSRGGNKQTDHMRRVVGLWRRAARTIEGWPQAGLANPNPRQMSLPFDAYPAPLEKEVETYLCDIRTAGDIWSEDEPEDEPVITFRKVLPKQPRSARTVRTRRYGVRALLWGAHQAGVPMEQLNSLRVILSPKVFRRSFSWHMARKGIQDKKFDDHLMSMVATIFSVANYCGVDGEERAELKAFFKKVAVTERRTGLIDRHERILERLEDPRILAMFLKLPMQIMHNARRLRDGWSKGKVTQAPRPVEAAWLASIAAAVEIELHAPVRITDLTTMRLGQELRLPAEASPEASGSFHFARTSKTGQGLQMPIRPETRRLLKEYLDDFRPLLPNANSQWVFPGKPGPAKPRDIQAFGTTITETIADVLGFRVNPHAFRVIAGALILKRDPHAIDDVRAILGHSTFDTAMKFYRRMNTWEAGRRLGEIIAEGRATGLPQRPGPGSPLPRQGRPGPMRGWGRGR
ncbi:tyrosine-type recombinase/integrase [Sediminicoccus rosea]|uniref:Tyr recombinase domain-containing protein n=1 Tax=Sediminicoccus rosea TaxID=1225128 RepID=A0ABZ0PLI7_9PROT|nr:tyrosine-type recombinase/integrase [Sediminicoccus rosea]WPB85960.1 hypothetical protein R9Z33_03615 [Sediminicoccus rosea]